MGGERCGRQASSQCPTVFSTVQESFLSSSPAKLVSKGHCVGAADSFGLEGGGGGGGCPWVDGAHK